MSTTDKSVANADEQVTKGTKRAAEVRLGSGIAMYLVNLFYVTFFFFPVLGVFTPGKPGLVFHPSVVLRGGGKERAVLVL